jgi:hypothetical protein
MATSFTTALSSHSGADERDLRNIVGLYAAGTLTVMSLPSPVCRRQRPGHGAEAVFALALSSRARQRMGPFGRHWQHRCVASGNVAGCKYLPFGYANVGVHDPGLLTVALSDITRDAVLGAISEYDRLGQDGFLERYGFDRAR